MKDNQPLVNKKYLLEKFSGKGGWTYAQIPEVLQDKHAPFGWVRVRGSIDGVTIKGYHLMPMGNGKLFLPVKAAIRKQINKKEGDHVHVILYADESPMEIPQEILDCFDDDPAAFQKFQQCTPGEQKAFIDWIYGAKTAETKAKRILEMMQKLILGLKPGNHRI